MIVRIVALATRIIRQVLRDKRTLALIFVVPVLIMTLLYLVQTNTSSVHTLALVRPTGVGSDRVNTLLDNLLPGKDKLHVISSAADQVDTKLKAGDADAALVFPADFTQQLAVGKKPSVQIVLEGSDPAVASAMHDLAEGIIHQLAIALAVSNPQQVPGQHPSQAPGQSSPPQQTPGQSAPQTPQQAAGSGPLPVGAALPLTTQSPRYLYGGANFTSSDSLAPVFIGIFSFFFVFLLTSVSFLRERTQGTIERVLVSPLKRTELVIGYVCGFTIFALVQSIVILLFVIFALRVHYHGNLALVFLVSLLLTIGSVNLGIFLSTFARNEFQVIQFIPLVFGIQIFLSGVLWPINQLPQFLRPVSYMLPLTYANDALRAVMLKGNTISEVVNQLGALLLFAFLMILLSALTMRREVA